MTADAFNGYVAAIVEKWTAQLMRKLDAALTAEQLVKSGSLKASLRAKVFKSVTGLTAQAQIDLNKYGRILDIKRPAGIKANSIDTNRQVLGIRRDRGRSWYNKTVYPSKFELVEMLLTDVSKLSKKEFLNWIAS